MPSWLTSAEVSNNSNNFSLLSGPQVVITNINIKSKFAFSSVFFLNYL